MRRRDLEIREIDIMLNLYSVRSLRRCGSTVCELAIDVENTQLKEAWRISNKFEIGESIEQVKTKLLDMVSQIDGLVE